MNRFLFGGGVSIGMERKHLKISSRSQIKVMSLIHQSRFLSGVIFLLVFGNCKIADLSSPPILSKLEENQTKAKQVLGANPSTPLPSFIQVELEDEWKSDIIRWMTPLSSSREKVSLRFKPGFDATEISAQILENKDSRKSISPSSGSLAKTYLESLSLYIQFPIIYKNFSKVAFSHHEKVNNQQYLVFYAAQNSWEAIQEEDQYLFYINEQTKSLDYAKFTYRNMMNNYIGILKFENYKKIGSMNYPLMISIQDSLEDQAFIHRIHILEIQFKP